MAKCEAIGAKPRAQMYDPLEVVVFTDRVAAGGSPYLNAVTQGGSPE